MRHETHHRQDGGLAQGERERSHHRYRRIERQEDAGEEHDGRIARQTYEAKHGGENSCQPIDEADMLKHTHCQRDG